MAKRTIILFLLCICSSISANAQQYSIKLGLLKYHGGGDWYANPTSIKNLASYCNNQLNMNVDPLQYEVEPSSPEIFNLKFIHTTGHGNITMTPDEIGNMRQWMMAGGLWHVDDNYGMDKYVRPLFKQVFPEYELTEVPYNHPIYNLIYNFNSGLPKVHEHDNKPPKGYAIIHEGRILMFYSSECDLGDGWEDPDVHNDPEERRQAALRMGANLVAYSCMF